MLNYTPPPHMNAKALIERAARLLGEWQRKYGEHQPDWLPPAGEVRWLEDAAAFLSTHTLPAPTVQALQVAAPGEPDAWIAQNGNTFDVSVKRPTEMGGYAQLDWQPLYRATPPHREPASSAEGRREAFEAWAGDQGFDLRRLNDGYLDLRTQGPWEAWQAARRSPSAPAGEPTDTQRDAERYRWLREHLSDGHGIYQGNNEVLAFAFDCDMDDKEGFDAIVDAAMRAALSAGSQKPDGGQGCRGAGE
jgi:hypothetical protein